MQPKIFYFVFHRDKKKLQHGEYQLVIDGELTARKCKATFLRVIIGESLQLKERVLFVMGKFTKNVPLIYRLNY